MVNKVIATAFCTSVFDGTHDTPKPSLTGHPLITSKHIMNNRINYEDAYLISEEDYADVQKRSAVSKWDVLFTMIGTVGEIYLEKNDKIPYAIKNMGVFSCGDGYKAKWLFYYLKSPFAKKYISNYLSGAVQKFVPLGFLRNFPIIPFDESKKKIVELLYNLDSKIELNNKINTELESMAKTIFDYWFLQFEFPNSEGKPYKSSGGKMVWNEKLKREIPEGWDTEMLFDAMDVQYGFPFSTTKFTEKITDIPIVRIRDILENTISIYTTEETDEKYKLFKQDLLIGMDGNFHLNFWDKDGSYLNQRSVRIRPQKDSTISNLCVYFELYPYIKAKEKNISRTTVGHLSDKDLKRLFLLKAKENVNFTPKKTFDSILEKIVSNRIEIQQLSEIRDFLLPMLMNGQVVVN